MSCSRIFIGESTAGRFQGVSFPAVSPATKCPVVPGPATRCCISTFVLQGVLQGVLRRPCIFTHVRPAGAASMAQALVAAAGQLLLFLVMLMVMLMMLMVMLMMVMMLMVMMLMLMMVMLMMVMTMT